MTDLTMSQFASKDDLIAAQAARIAELEAEVDAERHHHGIRNASAVRTLHALGYSWRGNDAWQPPAEQGKCLHQIAEPAAPAGKPIEDAIDALVMAAFTEGGCSEHRMSEARIQTELRKKELRTLLSTPQPCSRSHPHEEMTPMCELRTEIARLTNALARAEAAAQQAVQAAVQVTETCEICQGNGEIVTDWERYKHPHVGDKGDEAVSDCQECQGTGEVTPAHPAEGAPAQAAVPVVRGEVLVTVSGFTGSGKSAIAGEIEIMCRALGLQVEWPDGVTEKNMTHADWTTALELYNPRVRIIERNVPRNTASGADQ